MADPKTIPAALETLLRPRRLRRIHGTVARTRAEGAWFDAMLWSVFACIAFGVLLMVLGHVDDGVLVQHGIDDTYVVAGSVLVALFVAAALWWRWFKWHVHAAVLEQPDSSEAITTPRGP